MKLYTLDIQGIGPFADPVHIDFRSFADAGLFLLRGPTGSGKSTILDAIVFAVYGDVAKGGVAAKERLRSTFADPRTPSRVTLVFGVSSGVYRITRTPAYRKEGNTSETRATMLLEEVMICADGSFDAVRALATGVQEASATARSLVGLDKDQFLQTIILPQGQFARFLSASSHERQPILQSIFGTKRFTDCEKRLAARAREAGATLKDSQTAVTHARQRCHSSIIASAHAVNEAARALSADVEPSTDGEFPTNAELAFSEGSVSDEGVPDAALPTDGVPFIPSGDEPSQDDDYGALVAAQHDILAALTSRLSDVEAQHEQAVAAHAQAQRNRDLANEHARLTAELTDLEADAQMMADRQREVDLARQAESVREPLRLMETTWNALSQTHAAVRDALAEFSAHHEEGPSREPEPALPPRDASSLDDYLTDTQATLSAELVRLEPVVTLERSLPQRRQALEELRRSEQTATEVLNDLETQREALPDKRKALNSAIDTERELAATLDTRRTMWEKVKDRLADAQRLPELRQAEHEARRALSDAVTAAKTAQATATRMRSAWLADAAGALAGELRDGQPCVVCGSTTHPHPAATHHGGDPVSLDAVNAAQAESDAQHDTVNGARQTLDAASNAAHSCEERAQGSVEELTAQCEAARASYNEAKSAEQRLKSLLEDERALRTREEELASDIASHTRDCATLRATIAADCERLNADEKTVADARGSWPSIAERAENYAAWHDAVTQARTALTSFTQAHLRWADAQSSLDRWYADHCQAAGTPLTDPEQTTVHDSDTALPNTDLPTGAPPNAPLPDTGMVGTDLAGTDLLKAAPPNAPLPGDLGAASLTWVAYPWQSFAAPLPPGDLLSDVLPVLLPTPQMQTIADQHAALRSPAVIEDLSSSVHAYTLSLHVTRERLAHADFTGLTGDEDSVLTAATNQMRAAETRARSAREALSRAEARVAVSDEAVDDYEAANAALAEQSAEFLPIQRLSGLANASSSENTVNIPLSAWVLIRQFDEVVRAANPRLAEMSAGRYELARTDVSGRLSQKHGLDLVIIDHETDARRHPDTLSGGESFYVALSLALGLADVVSGESGGTVLESMFIDEGFGTLDEHTLDAVMTELQRLRDGGRLVGVVSHVPELARRIREHIVVAKSGKRGSYVRVIA